MVVTMSNGVLVVTGGSRGIGGGICRLAGERGWDVCVNYASSSKEADQVVSYIESKDGQAISFQADVSDSDAVERMFQEVDRTFGQVTGPGRCSHI